MGSPVNTKLALGIFAATGAVVVTYIVFKKFGVKTRSQSGLCHTSPETLMLKPILSDTAVDLRTAKSTTVEGHETPSVVEPSGDVNAIKPEANLGESYGPVPFETTSAGLGDDNQTSYIFLNTQENDTLSMDNGAKMSADRSSDESSCDVVEDEEEERMVKEGEVAVEQTENELLKEAQQDTNMVIAEEGEKSEVEVCSSSLYASVGDILDSSLLKEPFSFSGEASGEITAEAKADDKNDNAKEEEGKKEENVADHTMTDKEEDKSRLSGSGEGFSQETSSTEDSSFQSIDEAETDTVTQQMSSKEEGDDAPSSAGSSDDHEEVEVLVVSKAVLNLQPEGDNSSNNTLSLAMSSQANKVPKKLKPEEISEILTKCNKSPAEITVDQLVSLTSVLHRSDLPSLHPMILDSLVKVTSFTHNNSKLRSAGLPEAVSALTLSESQSVLSAGVTKEIHLLSSLCQVITNLTLDPETRQTLQPVVPALVGVLLCSDQLPEAMLRQVLLPLINFSSEPTFHSHFIPLIQHLFGLLDNGPSVVQIQFLRILVNLSLNIDVAPNILAVKCPKCIAQLLEQSTSPGLILRTLTLLVNLESAISQVPLTSDSLPSKDKTESLYITLTGGGQYYVLRNKVFPLIQHTDEDIRAAATKLHHILTAPTQ